MHISPSNLLQYITLVDRFGTEYLELTHPGSSSIHRENIIRAAGMPLNTIIVPHVRLNERDIQTALSTGVRAINTYIPIDPHGDFQNSFQHGLTTLQTVLAQIREDDIDFRVSVEHAFSLPLKVLQEIYGRVSHMEGVGRMGIAETTGVCLTTQFGEVIEAVYEVMPEEMILGVHAHNDIGLAAAKFERVLDIIAKNGRRASFDVTMGGIGERNGIMSYGDVLAIMYIYDREGLMRKYNIRTYADLVHFFTQATAIPIDRRDPLNPLYAASHTSGPHLKGIVENNRYQLINPDDFGFSLIMYVGTEVTGWMGVQAYAQRQLCLTIDEPTAKIIAAAIREYAAVNGPLDDSKLDDFIRTLYNENSFQNCYQGLGTIGG